MKIDLTLPELTSIIDALDLAIEDKIEQSRCPLDSDDKLDCQNMAEELSRIQEKLQNQMTAARHG